MKKLLIFLLCSVMLLSLCACNKETEPDTSAEENFEEGYVGDATVNRFLLDYKQYTGLTPQGLGLGELEGEYTFYCSLCEVRMLPTQYGLRISILGGDSASDLERMLRAFEIICQSADASCTEEQLAGAMEFIDQQTETAGGYRISNYLKILAYTPLVELETVQLDCKIDLLAMNYLPVEE